MSAPGLHPVRLTDPRPGQEALCVYRTGRGAVVFHAFASAGGASDARFDDGGGLQHTLTVAHHHRGLLMARLTHGARPRARDARLDRAGALLSAVAWAARADQLDTLDRVAGWLAARGVPFTRDTFGGE